MKNLKRGAIALSILIALLCAEVSASEKIPTPKPDTIEAQTKCIGGYLFAIITFRAAHGDGGGSVSIAQIFRGSTMPIKCGA